MAAHTWELVRDLRLAAYRGDLAEVARIEAEIAVYQGKCGHVENPEVKGRCYKCGAQMAAPVAVPRPGLVKAPARAESERKTG
jgi:hypothetical protein